MTSQLVGSSFANGAMLPNYVNGRLLAAEDLATGQCTLLARDMLIGQAAGYGIVSGLWVSAAATSLTVSAGLAINRKGQPVHVTSDVTLPLSTAAGTPAPADTSIFANCAFTPTGPSDAVTDGAYLLTALPVCQLQGQAPLSAPPDSTMPAGCTAQWEVEGVQFKAISLPLGSSVANIPVTPANRRSLLAHWCFGSDKVAQLGADPFHFDAAYTGFVQLAPADLTPCDVPLAVFYWENGAISFVDNWSARRRPIRPDALTTSWFGVVADQRFAEGHARFLEFQEQIDLLVASGTMANATAVADFGLLPPAGLLPIPLGLVEELFRAWRQRTNAGEFRIGQEDQPFAFVGDLPVTRQMMTILAETWPTTQELPIQIVPFFGDLATFGGIVHWDCADRALQQSWHDAAVNPAQTSSTASDKLSSVFFEGLPPTVFISYYLIYENVEAIIQSLKTQPPATVTPCLLFVSRGIDRAMRNSIVQDKAVPVDSAGGGGNL
jgi:hypothetical protein